MGFCLHCFCCFVSVVVVMCDLVSLFCGLIGFGFAFVLVRALGLRLLFGTFLLFELVVFRLTFTLLLIWRIACSGFGFICCLF